MNVVRLIASRYGFSPDNRHRGTSVTILISIALCFLAMTLVLSFMKLLASDRISHLRTYESYDVVIPASSLEEAREIAGEAGKREGVLASFVFSDCPVLLNGAMMTARFLEEESEPMKKLTITRGEGKEGVYLPSRLSSLAASGRVKLISLRSGKQARVVPKAEMFSVAGYYHSPDSSFNSAYIILPLREAESFRTSYSVGIYGEGNIDKLAARLGGVSCREANASLYGALRLEQTVMDFVFLLLLFLVVSSVHRSSRRLVECKMKEIGMLRTLGLGRKSILKVFLFQSLFISILALLLGGGLALLLIGSSSSLFASLSRSSYLFRSGDALPLPSLQMALVSLFVLLSSLLFTYLGTRKVLGKSLMEMLDNG